MKTIQIRHDVWEGEECTDIIAVIEMTGEEFKQQESEVDLIDDGGSHVLVEYTQARVDELIERNASGLDKLGDEYTLFLDNERGEHSEELIHAADPNHAQVIAQQRENELNGHDLYSWSVITKGY